MPKKKRKLQVGEVVQIPLPDGTYAYGRKFKDTGLAIYQQISKKPNSPPQAEDYRFIIGFNGGAVESGEWSIVDQRPFADEESSWPPPKYIKDAMNGKYEIYHKGMIRAATEDECQGLERASVWNANHIVDRIMGSDKWN